MVKLTILFFKENVTQFSVTGTSTPLS